MIPMNPKSDLPPPRKKLIEVALPLEAINRESAREKSIRHGHPSTLHLWWARRPLAACRAVLFSSLVDDPSSDPQFRRPDGTVDEERAGEKRAELFNLIEEFVKWENSSNPKVIDAARAEIARCVASRKIETGELTKEAGWDFVIRRAKPEAVNAFLAEHAPPVLDPFCGGGSIPLEAQRLGLRAFGSDLNPVPVLITKALIEIPPKFAGMPPVNPESRGLASGTGKNGKKKATQATFELGGWKGAAGLAEDVRYYGKWMRDEAQKRIGHLYPKITVTEAMARDRKDLKEYIGQELTVIAWLWARTVPSPNPAAAGAHVPLVRSFWLSTKEGKKAWVEPVVKPDGKSYTFEVRRGTPTKDFDPKKGTVIRSGGTCLLTNQPMPFEHVRAEAKAGRMSARLMAIVAEGSRGRVYLSPTAEHEKAAEVALPKNIPDTPIPEQALGFRVQLYGMDKHYKLFTNRQLTALTTFSDLVMEARARVLADAERCQVRGSRDEPHTSDLTHDTSSYADAVATYLAFAIDRIAMTANGLCRWNSVGEKAQHAFGRQALSMIWDYVDPNPFASATGSLEAAFEMAADPLPFLAQGNGSVRQHNASQSHPPPRPLAVSTDPPYYDNVGYADLSDFFYVWLRRSLATVHPELFRTVMTPKAEELIATPYRHEGDREKACRFFEVGLGRAFERMTEAQHLDYPLTVYYGFKQSETEEEDSDEGDSEGATVSTGWETMLEGLILSGLSITGTWPVRTEMRTRMRGRDSNALASSIVLVCHPRPESAPMASRREFVTALKRELPAALRDLQSGNIAPVDLAQAAIGPGMAAYTRYSKVVEASGERVGVRAALALINQMLDEVLAEQEGDFDADSRWALAWFEQSGFTEGEYGVAETLSKAKNTSIHGLEEAGILVSGRGKVRLLKPAELPADWDPTTDSRLTAWEMVHHLIRALESGGELAAATIAAKLGGNSETARELCYRLYMLCERKKRAADAMAYNRLVQSWPEISRLSRDLRKPVEQQGQMFSERGA